MRLYIRLLMALIICQASLSALGINSARALEIRVNWVEDAVDYNSGIGVCNIGSNPLVTHCSLRAAIQTANASPGTDTITLPPGTYILSIPGSGEFYAATGDLDIRDDLTIQSDGPLYAATTIVDASQIDRVFRIAGNVFPNEKNVQLNNFTITDGRLASGQGGGGGIFLNNASLLLDGMIITGNEVLGMEDTDIGGGILNSGSSVLEIRNSTLSGNTASRGGAIFHAASSMAIYDSTLNDNSAAVGGGILNYTTFNLTNVTLSDNTASNIGGGISSFYVPLTEPETPLLRHCTIVNNVSENHPIPAGGGLRLDSNAEISLLNSIVAGNTGGDCKLLSGSAIINASHNLSSDDTCDFTEADSLENTDPLLGPLANNGGRTLTHLPQKDSPVINAGFNLILPELAKDQRGVYRPQDGVVDIGAVEVESAVIFFPIKTKNGKVVVIGL